MTFPSSFKATALDAQTYTLASLHTAFPGTTGANEVTGGAPAYAKKAITINATSGGIRSLNAAVVFDIPLGATVRWVGYWNVGTFLCTAPNGGGTPKNFMAIPSTDIVYSTAHGYADTTKIVFFNGTPPTGLTEGTVYFVRDSTTDTFKVTATSGGTAIDLTGASSFGCVVCGITEDVFAAQGTQTLSTSSISIPD